MEYTIHVYGNGDFFYTVMTSAAFFMNSAKSFFLLATILGLVFFAFEATGVMPSRGYDWMKFVKTYVIMSVFVLTPFIEPVNIHDVITDDNRVVNLQNNKLPFGLVLPFVFTSKVIYTLINLYQQNFEIDSNLNYTYSGMNFGANFIQSLDNATSYDKNFDYDLDQYLQNCGFPLMYKKGLLSTLTSSPDILATLKANSSDGRWVQQIELSSGNRMIMSCQDAINAINAYYTNHSDAILKKNVQMMGISTGNGYDRFLNAANATATSLMNISQGASAAMKQAISMNMIMASIKDGAHAVGNGNLALAAYDAEQFQQYKTTSMLNGAAAARTVPILVATALAILVFLYPIMIFLAIVAGSYRAIGIFLQILLAVNLMPLIFEILNYITTFYLQKKLGIIIQGGAYTYDISTSLYSFTDNMITAGNYLVASTPIIAYAVVSGSSMALTSVFGQINDPAKSQSAKVGEEYSHGTQNLGNTSIDNHSSNNVQSNKLDDQISTTSGVPIQREYTPTGMVTNQGGQKYFSQGKSNLNTSVDIAQSRSEVLSNAQTSMKQTMNNIGDQWNNTKNQINDKAKTALSNDSVVDNNSISDRTQLDALSRMSAEMGFLVKSGDSTALNNGLTRAKDMSKSLLESKNEDVRNAANSILGLAETTSYQVQQQAALSKALTDSESKQSAVRTDYTHQFAKWMDSKGINPNDLSPDQQYQYGLEFVKDDLNHQYGLDKNLDKPLTPDQIKNLTKGKPKPNMNPQMPEIPNANPNQLPGGNSNKEKYQQMERQVTSEQQKFNDNPEDYILPAAQQSAKPFAGAAGNIMYDVSHIGSGKPNIEPGNSSKNANPNQNQIPD